MELIMQGEILWFDHTKGEGEVISNSIHYYFHYTAIIDLDRTEDKFWEGSLLLGKENWIILKKFTKGIKVEFNLYENLYMKQIDSIWII